MLPLFRLSSLLIVSLLFAGCDMRQTLTEGEQIERSIRQEVLRKTRALDALVAAADNTAYDSFAWRRGERIQIRQRQENGQLLLLPEAEAPEVIATAVEHKTPSFSLVRYQQGWLVVFNTYVTAHCQVVYAYAYRGQLPEVSSCNEAFIASEANGQCQSPINADWQVFKEWFFAETLLTEGNPQCLKQAAAGWKPANQ